MIAKCNGHITPDLNVKWIELYGCQEPFIFCKKCYWLVRSFTRVKSSDVSFKITFVSFQTYIDVCATFCLDLTKSVTNTKVKLSGSQSKEWWFEAMVEFFILVTINHKMNMMLFYFQILLDIVESIHRKNILKWSNLCGQKKWMMPGYYTLN